MQIRRKPNFYYLSISIRVIFALVLILPAISPAGMVQASEMSAVTAPRITAKSETAIESNTPQPLPFTQSWTNTTLINVNDDWASIPGIIGYIGNYTSGSPTGVDPQILLSDYITVTVDVIANQVSPNTLTAGGVAEFEITDPVVALQGSGTADAPFIMLFVDTTGYQDITVSYNLRDVDGSADNAVQQVALHYRVGPSGDFTNIPEGYVADATTGPSLATQVTPINVTLPSDVNNQPLVVLRVMTTNAPGSDEWVGVDDLSITGTPLTPVTEMTISKAGPAIVNVNQSFDYTLTVGNSLGMTADQVVITDSLPVSVTFLSASDGGVLIDTNVVSWTILSMADSETAQRTVTVAAPDNGATLVNFDYGVWASNWLTWTVGIPVTTTVRGTDIGITKTCPPSPVDPGQTITYTLNYTVTDPPIDGVVITDVLPVDVTYVGDNSGVIPAQPVAGTLVWDLGTMATSDSFVVTGTVSADPTQYFLVNEAHVDATNDALSSNNSASCSNTRSGPVTIHDIQYTTIPGPDSTYPSPLTNKQVTTVGTVCAVEGRNIFIAEAPGPWHSITAYLTSTAPKPSVGTKVEVNGTIQEYYGFTEFSYTGGPLTITTLGPGDPVCDFTPVDGSTVPDNNAGLSEPYESVMVQYQHLSISSISDSRGNDFNDSGGPGNWGNFGYFPTPRPVVGTQYEFLRGPLAYSFSLYRVMPPTSADAMLLDITPPTVVSTDPITGTTGVSIYKPVYATFSEAINPATLVTSTFTLTGPGGDVSGAVSYNAAGFKATFVPSTPLSPTTAYTATLTTGIEDITGNGLAADYVWTFETGVTDVTPPSILGKYPAAEAIDAPLSASIVITFSEDLNPASLIGSNFDLVGPYGDVPWSSISYESSLFKVTLDPSGLLLPTSRYTVTLGAGVVDWAGLSVPVVQRSWSFTTQAEPPMYAYHGDIHNHTSYSDGSGTPDQAFTEGQANGLDFMALTDHSYAIDDTEWADTLAQANAHNTNGEFITLRGFEYTQGGEGHANVYNTVRHAVRTDTTSTCTFCDYTPNLEAGSTVEGFYHWLTITGTLALDSNGTVMQFNHPGWINFNDWAYHPEDEDIAQLEEVGNGWGSSYVFSWDEFIRSLDYGWQVGATNNTDNHNVDWGAIGPNRTGVVMAGLTRADLMEALNARRTFATEDSNAELFFKANGFWMGSEIPNTGSMTFHTWGSDPDSGDLIASVELVTAEGRVVASIEPNTSDFDWSMTEEITPGAHYYLILVTEADGDRIVSSPVWTQGVEDVRITDLTIQPSLPTIYNPSMLSARITNRGASAQTLTVNFNADGDLIGTKQVTVLPCTTGPCSDGYATISWQPVVTGSVTISVSIEGAPASDNPDDNSRTLQLDVTDLTIPLILIDAGHNNIGIDQQGISKFVDDMTQHGYNVLFNLDKITASDLPTDTVKLLILSAYGPNQLDDDEMQAIGDYVAAGGNLWLNGASDYNSQVYWLHNVSNRLNALITTIETSADQQIPIRFNDDEVLDGNNNNGYPWGVLWHNYPVSDTTGVGMNVAQIQSWSDSSLIDRNGGALTTEDLGANGFMMVLGDDDAGTGTYGEANRTHNKDAEVAGYPTNDAFLYMEGTILPGGAGYDLTGNGGRIMFYTDSNDVYNTFAYVAGDGKQNELFNLETVMWLMGQPLHKSTIAEARAQTTVNQPDNLDKLVWVEGTITAAYGEFFNVLYVQDKTGGITVHAPAGDIDSSSFTRGTKVRVVGTVGIYNGDTEIEFFEAEMVQVLEPGTGEPLAKPMSTYQASLEVNQGWLSVITGTVTSKVGEDTLFMNDGTGPVRIFLDGYNGDFSDIQVNDLVRVTGLVSEDGNGQRVRVRNHGMHPYADDVIRLAHYNFYYLPIIARH